MDESLQERMEQYRRLSEQVSETASERDALADEVSDALADIVADGVAEAGANVAAERVDGQRFRVRPRLDRAALVATVTDRLPGGFVVSHVNEDGSLTVEWVGERDTPSSRRHGALLKAVVAEETSTDRDGLIESVPTRERVLSRAVELGLDEADARDRLQRLTTLGIVDIADGRVYPGENFSRS